MYNFYIFSLLFIDGWENSMFKLVSLKFGLYITGCFQSYVGSGYQGNFANFTHLSVFTDVHM